MRVLVTGGAGYLGSHTTLKLAEAGHDPVIADDFRNSKRSVIPRLEKLAGRSFRVHEVNLTDRGATLRVFDRERPEAVMHFAGLKAVEESAQQPATYYENNLGSLLSVLAGMDQVGARILVFSSSATVYGPDGSLPLREDAPVSATNPYGWTKVMQEQILRDVAAADPTVRFALLRYFNPVGAHPSGEIGEDPQGIPTNLMPLLLQVAAGQRQELLIYGNDYATSDGAPRRDYLHVQDLAEGHVAALRRLTETAASISTWNLGTGRSTSVTEMVAAFSRACGHQVPTRVVGRRPGDVADSVADPTRAKEELGWVASRTLTQMCQDSWRWWNTHVCSDDRAH